MRAGASTLEEAPSVWPKTPSGLMKRPRSSRPTLPMARRQLRAKWRGDGLHTRKEETHHSMDVARRKEGRWVGTRQWEARKRESEKEDGCMQRNATSGCGRIGK